MSKTNLFLVADGGVQPSFFPAAKNGFVVKHAVEPFRDLATSLKNVFSREKMRRCDLVHHLGCLARVQLVNLTSCSEKSVIKLHFWASETLLY